jgi:hypothetical protein
MRNACVVVVDESMYPDQGTLAVSWNVTLVGGRSRLSWTFHADPRIDPPLAIALLRDVAAELEEDQPA